MSGHWSTSTSAGAAIVFLGDQSPVPTQDRIRGDDARDLRQDPPAEFVTAHSESTTLGVRQAKRPRAQVFSEDPILLPEIVDQIVLVTVHPASEREDEELQRRWHSLRLLGRLDQHRPSLGRFFAPYAVKNELADQFASHGDGKMELFDYIEVFYNQRRRHSTIGRISPAAFERRAQVAQVA